MRRVLHAVAVAAVLVAPMTLAHSATQARVDPSGDLTVLDPSTTFPERDPVIAHDHERDRYLIVNERTRTGGILQIVATLVDGDGAIITPPTVVHEGDLYTGDAWSADVAYNPETDEFLVVFTGVAADHDAQIEGRRVDADGQPVGTVAEVNAELGAGRICQGRHPQVEFDPSTGGYVVGYVHYYGAFIVGATCGALPPGHSTPVLAPVAGDLTVGTPIVVPLERRGDAPRFDLARNPATGSFAVLGVDQADDDGAFLVYDASLALTATGVVPRPIGLVGGFDGHRLAADPTTGEWLVTSSLDTAVATYTHLLDDSAQPLREQVMIPTTSSPVSIAALDDSTWLVGLLDGRVVQVGADGSQLFRLVAFAAGSNRNVTFARGPLGAARALAVGVDPATNRLGAVVLDAVAPAIRSLLPARLLDTRRPPAGETIDGEAVGGGQLTAGTVLTLDVAGRGGVPDDARAVVVNIAAAGASRAGFVTGFPCDADRPTTSNLNFPPGAPSSAAGFLRLSASGTACFFVSADIELIVDVNGYVPAGGSIDPLVPRRLLESRPGQDEGTTDGRFEGDGRLAAGETVELVVDDRGGVAAGAETVIVNVTAISPSTPLFVTVHPCGTDRPTAANLNAPAGGVVNNLVTARVGDGGAICLFVSAETDLVVDVAAFVPAGGGLLAGAPARLLETRPGLDTVDGEGESGIRLRAGQPLPVVVAGRGGARADATGAMVNIAAIRPSFDTFIVAYPCDQQPPNAANVNVAAGAVVSNAAFVRLDPNGRLCLRSSGEVDVALDLVAVTADG